MKSLFIFAVVFFMLDAVTADAEIFDRSVVSKSLSIRIERHVRRDRWCPAPCRPAPRVTCCGTPSQPIQSQDEPTLAPPQPVLPETTPIITGPQITQYCPGGICPTYAMSDNRSLVLSFVNNLRARRGLRLLTWDSSLESSASQWSQAMASRNRMFHSRLGFGLARRENIAMGQSSVEQVLGDWRRSPGHLANMLAPDVTRIAVSQAGTAWTMHLR